MTGIPLSKWILNNDFSIGNFVSIDTFFTFESPFYFFYLNKCFRQIF